MVLLAEPPVFQPSVNVAEILRVLENALPRDRFGETQVDKHFTLLSDLKLLLGIDTPDSTIIEELRSAIEGLKMSMRELTLWRQTVMATLEQFTAAFARIDTATTAIADRIKKLEDSIKNMGLTAAQEDTLLGQLSGLADSLDAMGKEPTNPVPVPPPPPVT